MYFFQNNITNLFYDLGGCLREQEAILALTSF
jgi:hypothetical protein